MQIHQEQKTVVAHESAVLLQENTRPHVHSMTQTKRAKFKLEQLDHFSYRPDMSSCDSHVFGLQQKHLKGELFN